METFYSNYCGFFVKQLSLEDVGLFCKDVSAEYPKSIAKPLQPLLIQYFISEKKSRKRIYWRRIKSNLFRFYKSILLRSCKAFLSFQISNFVVVIKKSEQGHRKSRVVEIFEPSFNRKKSSLGIEVSNDSCVLNLKSSQKLTGINVEVLNSN